MFWGNVISFKGLRCLLPHQIAMVGRRTANTTLNHQAQWGESMSNVIQFLESMGGNASMARMTTADYEAAIAMLDADDASRRALRLRDHSTLNELLNGRRKMMFAVAAPEESPAEEQNPGDGDGDDEKQQAE